MKAIFHEIAGNYSKGREKSGEYADNREETKEGWKLKAGSHFERRQRIQHGAG
jgi:hypothetical protein